MLFRSPAFRALMDERAQRIVLTEDLVPEQLRPRALLVVEVEEQHPVLAHEFARQQQPWGHERQPTGVIVPVIFVRMRVARVVRRIDIDDLDQPAMRGQQRRQRRQIVPDDEEVLVRIGNMSGTLAVPQMRTTTTEAALPVRDTPTEVGLGSSFTLDRKSVV